MFRADPNDEQQDEDGRWELREQEKEAQGDDD